MTNCSDAYIEINYQAEWAPGDYIPNPKILFPAGMIKSTTIKYDPIANPTRVTMVTKWTVPSTPGTYEVKAYVQVGETKYAEKTLTITVTNCPTLPGGPGGGGLE